MASTVRILCVDDQLTSRQVMVRTLSHFLAAHFDETLIRAVDSGEEAITFLRGLHRRRSSVDLVLTDLHMPGMSGIDLLQRMKRNIHTEQVPVVLVSADEIPIDDPRFDEAAPALVLDKPLTREKPQRILTLL